MRAFIAIEVPEAIRIALDAMNGRLRERLDARDLRVSWVRPENMHLTLRFLGDVTDGQIAGISTHMDEACRAEAPFPLEIAGTGAFPNPRRPSVIWVGAGPLEGPLGRIQEACEAAAQAAGLAPEEKAFHPHLTLARIKEWRGSQPLMERLEREKDVRAGEFTVRDVTLFSSALTSRGPIYRRLKEFCL